MSTYDRDQTETMKAIQSFEGFIKSYPDSPYRKDATTSLKETRTVLAKHNLYVGRFYLKKGNKKAACNRFQAVKQNYADTDLGEDLDSLIAKACSTSVSAPK